MANPVKKNKSEGVKAWCAKHPVLSGLCLMFLVGLLIAWLIMMFLSVWTHHGDNTTVPQVRHVSFAQATRTLNEAGLSIEIADSLYDKTYPPGTVMESWPKAGSQVKSGRTVYVTVTAFSPKHVTVTMPVTGVSSRQALSYLSSLGITGVRVISVPGDYPDLVESATYNGRPLGVGSTLPVDAAVVLNVSAGRVQEPEAESSYDETEAGDADEAVTAEDEPDQSQYYD
ncbi:MAG: PASTA domain-containing protein [Muribaculaceae bacterium]|nr:PASTA domain-containing protein [Muribaculaceae bacterium]